ncbi:hypothetical protein [Pseudokineococcus sp. 1T1Z-3]|uniref:hypothetical protein n=1 Tax=Pseudokineococcus sp. 1T1Z-3 TaxID=3132745 RepID=UPI003097124F
MKLISALTAGTLLAAGGVVAVAVPATSASGLTTRCDGTATGVTIPGDLVVPPEGACVLTDVVVQGSTRVAPGADLVAEGSTFGNAVLVAEDSYFEVNGSEVDGRVTSRQGWGVALFDSSATSVVVRMVDGSAVDSRTTLEASTVDGQVDVRTGELELTSSSVSGPVRAIGTVFADVVDSTIGQSLDVVDNAEGGVFCESEVYGPATYTGNGVLLQIGADGPVEPCDMASFWGSDVTISDNMAEVFVDQNIVAGSLSGTGNDPAPTVGDANRVRGSLGGQFAAGGEAGATIAPQALEASIARTAASEPSSADLTVESVTQRSETTAARLAERSAKAEAAAVEAGPIDL